MYPQMKKIMKNNKYTIIKFTALFMVLISCDSNSYEVRMCSTSDFGINEGEVVMATGSPIGSVESIKKISRDSTVFILEIKNDIKLPNDSEFVIRNSSLLGDNYININIGKNKAHFLKEGDVVNASLKPNLKLDSLVNSVINKLDSAKMSMQ